MITTTDPIADMLSRIRNAILVRKNEVSMPHSNVKEAVARLLVDCNFLNAVKVSDADVGKTLLVTINAPEQNARITEITRLSKPGRRHYTNVQKIPVIKRGRGIVIVSTSKGMLTGNQAKAAGLGGELICQVY